ncbi:response regulator [Methanoregula sp.]|jgi:DNA-binding response OmpR family regulator|uniref:response regulator n=1 Tax=Methanoregula sp. TaxID=2052170 RepID=UPI003C792345
MVMNSEPSGTDADIPEGESAIDVFILCKDDRDSQELCGQLAPQGYRVTLFSDSADLVATLRTGKPNLLICDATGPDKEGYDVCREIKADYDLWRIPILLVTGVSSLGDLLVVLDSNADNFLARPYDPQYLLSLIETMLSSPVEKPDPEKIRTQFKIRHEDRDYVIMADRRKLLEFLLSSFEIAVDRAGELAQVQNALDGLKVTFERRVSDRTNELVTETARLQMLLNGKTRELEAAAKALGEQKKEESALRSTMEEREKVITAHRDDVTRLSQEIESTRARLAEAEDTVRTLGNEKDELEHALRGDAESLNRDLGQTKKDLDEAKKELAVLASQRSKLEVQVAEFSLNHEDAQKALSARTMEIGQLKSDLASEKNRAEAAEMEVKSILQEKARSEQDLRHMVEDITEKAQQQSRECLRLADELALEKEQKSAAEQKYSEFVQEQAKKEAVYAAEKSTIAVHYNTLQQKYDALTESYCAERQKTSSLEADIARITAAQEQADQGLQSAKEAMRVALAAGEDERNRRLATETNAAEMAKAKDEEIQALKNDVASLRAGIESAQADLLTARQERDIAQETHENLKEDLAAALLAGSEADKLSRSTANEMEQVKEELDTEQRLHREADDNLSAVTRAKEMVEHDLKTFGDRAAAQEHELLAKIQGLTDTLDAEKEARLKAEDTLARIAAEKDAAHQKLSAIDQERIADKETGEQAALRERELLAKIEGLTDTLDAERDARSKAEDDLARITAKKEAADQKLLAIAHERVVERVSGEQAATRERELLTKIQDLTVTLDAERDARSKAEDDLAELTREKEAEERQLRAVTEEAFKEESPGNERITTLEADLKTALERQRSLEEQLRAAEREQADKEAAVQVLTAEIEKATAALHAEKEERHAAEEAYAEAKDALVALRKKPQIPSTAIEEVPIGDHALIAKKPDLPVMIFGGPHAPARKEIDRPVPVQPTQADPITPDTSDEPENPHLRIKSVEDLFEDPREIKLDELPDAIPTTRPQEEEDDISGTPVTDPQEIEPIMHSENDNLTDDLEDDGDDICADDIENTEDGAADVPVNESVMPTFSRQQWFDLVKWAHNANSLSHEDRIRIVKLGRLIQKGRVLTHRQEAQLAELVMLAHAKGYRPPE